MNRTIDCLYIRNILCPKWTGCGCSLTPFMESLTQTYKYRISGDDGAIFSEGVVRKHEFDLHRMILNIHISFHFSFVLTSSSRDWGQMNRFVR